MGKRANNEGSISKRKDGRWEVKHYDQNHKRHTAYAKTQAEAKTKLQALRNDVDRGLDVQGQNMLFSEWLKIWLREYARPSVKLSTYMATLCDIVAVVKVVVISRNG